MTRFLLTPLALPVNLIAGAMRYPWTRYLAAVLPGEAIWVLLLGGAGYAFAGQWEAVNALVADLGGLLLGVVLVAFSGGWLVRRSYRARH